MIQFNILNKNLSNSKHKLKSGIKNSTEVTLIFSSNIICDSYVKTIFLHKLLLTNLFN